MNQIAFLPSGCSQYQASCVVVTPLYLCYSTTISIYVHCNDEDEGYPLLRVLTGPNNPISSFTINDDIILAITPSDKKVFMWSANNGDPYGNVPSSLFSGVDSPLVVGTSILLRDRIVFGCDCGKLIVWNYLAGKSITLDIKDASDSFITCIAFSTQVPQLFAVGSNNGVVAVIDSETFQIIEQIDCFDSLRASKEGFFDRLLNQAPRVSAIAFDPLSRNYLLASSSKGFMVLIDMETKSVVHSFDPSPVPFASISFLPGQPGCFVTTDGVSSSMQYWNVSARQSLRTMRPKGQVAVKCARALPANPASPGKRASSPLCMVGFSDGSVSLYNTDTNRIQGLDTIPGHCETVFDCKFSHSDPDLMSSASYDGTIRIWNVKRMELQFTINARKPVYCADWSPKGDMIVAGMTAGEVALFTLAGKEIWRKKIGADVIWRVVWCRAEAGIIAATGRDGTVAILAAQDGSVFRSYNHACAVFGADFDPYSGKLLAIAGYDGKARIHHLETTKKTPVITLIGHTSEVSQILFNPYIPHIIATTSSDNTVRVWQLPQEIVHYCNPGSVGTPPNLDTANFEVRPLMTMEGHTDKVRGLAWSHLCPYICLSGSWDSSVRVWDTRNGSCLHVARAHNADVYAISSHPLRPTIFVTASRDTTMRFWYHQQLSQLHLDAAVGLLREDTVSLSTVVIGGGVTPQSSAFPFPCAGPAVEGLLKDLESQNAPHQRLRLISKFFDFPNGGQDLISCAMYRCTRDPSTIDTNCTVVPIDHLAAVAKKRNAEKVEIAKRSRSSAVGKSVREQQLRDIAEECLRLGNTQMYCEFLMEARAIDRALAAAPMVSLDFWRQLCRKAAELQLEEGDVQKASEYFILAGEGHKAADVLASNGQYAEGVVVVQSCAQARADATLSGLSGLPPQVDALQAQNKIASFAKSNAAKLFNGGHPMLATASLLAADIIDPAVELLLRSGCIPLGHLLFHAIPCSQELLNFGFTQALLMSASNKRWRTATIALDRLTPTLRLVCAADALALVFSDAESYNDAKRLEVERILEPYFQSPAHEDQRSAMLGISLWNSTTQGQAAAQDAHTQQVINNANSEISTIVEELVAIVASNGTVSADLKKRMSTVRRWLHYAIVRDNTPIKHQVLFLAFVNAILIAKFVFNYSHLLEGAIKLAERHLPNTQQDIVFGQLLERVRRIARVTLPVAALDFGQRCLTLGAKLPARASGRGGIATAQKKSILTDEWPQGPQLQLDDGESSIPLQEALEWYRCCWFSPLGTGRRILPY